MNEKRISVQVKTRSKSEGVELLHEGNVVVRINVLPIHGRANQRVVELLADFFKRPKSKIDIIKGHRSKKKIVTIKME